MASNLPSFPPFHVSSEPNNIGPRWEKYVKRLETAFVGFNVTNDNQKRALLLYYAGDEVTDIFDTLPDQGKTYAEANKALTTHFCPDKEANVEFERFMFRKAAQQPNETVADFHVRLQKLASSCNFSDK